MDEFYDLTSGASAGLTFRGAPLPGKSDDQKSKHYFYNTKEYIKSDLLYASMLRIEKP
jgi:hypothetical protein